VTWTHPSFLTKKIKKTTSPEKAMATVFWDIHEVLFVYFTPRGATINSVRYQGILTGPKGAVRRNRHGLLSQGALLLHDNARPHIARTTVNLLNTWHWEILPHSPCGPDLAPSDFPMFPKSKKHLRGLRFRTDEDVQHEVTKRWLRLQDASFYHQDFDSLICRYDKCLNRYGNYTEKHCIVAYIYPVCY
jgi:histone-lysine N-methyltransferase SETMAR